VDCEEGHDHLFLQHQQDLPRVLPGLFFDLHSHGIETGSGRAGRVSGSGRHR
jgi:hypothetical protein